VWDLIRSLLNEISWSSAAGVVFGAAIGATVSYLLQRNSFAEARRQKEADKREERRALGLNVFTKMIRIASTLELLRHTLDIAFSTAKAKGIKAPPWALVIPIANFPPRVHFEPKELTEIMRLDFELFNNIGPFDDVHNSVIDAFELYRTERNAITGTMKAEMSGNLGSTSFTAEEMRALAPRMAALDTLIDGMIKRTKIDAAEAWDLLQKLQAALNKEYNLKLTIERRPFTKQVSLGY
jgi:hypothetical protein